MPTLIDLDGFAHQTDATAQGGSGFIGTYDGHTGTPTFDTTVKRAVSSVASLKLVMDGATPQEVDRNITAGNRLLVASFYIRYTAAPSVLSRVFRLLPGASNACLMQVETTGNLTAIVSGGTAQTTAGSLADGLWHLIDVRVDVSTTTFTIDWQVDGAAQTQATRTGQTAADFTTWMLGNANAATGTLTVWFSDFVLSATTADYPIGAHHIYPIYPTGDGTHNLLSHIAGEGAETTNLYQHVDDWNGSTPSTTDYLAQTTIDTGAFAEVTFSDAPASDSGLYDVIGYIAGFCQATGADTADTQILTAHGGTLIDHIGNLIDYSGSTTVLGYHRTKLARPAGNWSDTVLNAVVAQWGFSTDITGNPRLSAIMFEYAAPGSGVATTTTHGPILTGVG